MKPLVLRGFCVFGALVVCPLIAWNLAVSGANHGLGWLGFFLVLLGLSAVGTALGAVLLRRGLRAAAFGTAGTLVASFVLFAVLFSLALRTLTF